MDRFTAEEGPAGKVPSRATTPTPEELAEYLDLSGEEIERLVLYLLLQEPLREKLGKLVNAAGRDIALTQNATFGMNFLANGLDLKTGDEVILTDREHPGGISGWRERAKRDGVVLKQVPISTPANDPDHLVESFAQMITSRTRVLAFPHIISGSGVVMPVKRLTQLAHHHGCLSLIDGAQALGQVKVDLQEIGCTAFGMSTIHEWDQIEMPPSIVTI